MNSIHFVKLREYTKTTEMLHESCTLLVLLRMGGILVGNVAGTGVKVIATKEMMKI
ncbi:MAG: hypothetical protein R3Y54_05085 [Eubacteriales bacterium]